MCVSESRSLPESDVLPTSERCAWSSSPFDDGESMTVAVNHENNEKLYHSACFTTWAARQIGAARLFEESSPEAVATHIRLHAAPRG